RKTQGIIPSQGLRVAVTGTWQSVDEGDIGRTVPPPPSFPEGLDGIPVVWQKRCWGIVGTPDFIDSPTDVIILSALMEEDDRFGDVRTMVTGLMAGGLGSLLLPFTQGKINRTQLRDQLLGLFNGAVQTAAAGFPSNDDQIGSAQALELTAADLKAARESSTVKSLRFQGQGGDYHVYYELSH
ncbi:MAG TPA: hypothetical protein VIJ61_17635, partial [Thermoanaerobaculia bacterium]